MKAKRYEIDTLEQLINTVNSENFDRISVDFLLWLHQVSETFEKVKAQYPEYKDTPNSEIGKVGFIWIDDGKNQCNKVNIKNTTTGEISEIKLKTRKENGRKSNKED